MKYIRTKNGIYEANDEFKIEDEVLYEKDQLTFDEDDYVWFSYGEVISQADTIEELCDGFIAETEDITKFRVEPTLENAKMYCGIKNIYGAIWTDRGLIYVAKMDENGKLVLI